MSRGRLKPEDEKCIRQNYLYLKQNLKALDIVDYLYQHDVIALEDKEHIKVGLTRTDQNEILLTTLLNAGPGEAFNFFLKSLEPRHQHVLENIKQTVKQKKEDESLQEENKILKSELLKQKQENNSLQEEIKISKSELTTATDKINNLQDEINSIAYTTVKQKQENESLQEEIKISKSELTTAKDKINNLQDEINSIAYTTDVELCERREVKLLKENSILKDTLECYKKENQNLTEKLVERDKEMKIWKNNYDTYIKSLKNQINSEQEPSAVQVDSDQIDSEQNADDSQEIDLEYINKNGKHEVDMYLNEENDLAKRFADCKKNTGHANFIPFETFNINDLPKNFHTKNVFKHTQALGKLTVKIDVEMTSLDRPEFVPDTTVPYPFSDIRGSTIKRSGSGFVYDISNAYSTCTCSKCRESETPKTESWIIFVVTTPEVVFDRSEAMRTSARLFYNKDNSPSVLLNEFKGPYFENNLQPYMCFQSCDTKSCCKLNKNLQKLKKYATLLEDEDFKDTKLVFVVSHPHGGPKKITIGKDLGNVNLFNPLNVIYRLIYSSSTCSGSTGGPVYRLDFTSKRVFDRYVTHSGALNGNLGYSKSLKYTLPVVDSKSSSESESPSCYLM